MPFHSAARVTGLLAGVWLLVLQSAGVAGLFESDSHGFAPGGLAQTGATYTSWRMARDVTIDGDLGDWGAIQPMELNRYTAETLLGVVPDLFDSSAQLRSMWTPDALYFAVSVRDEAIVNDSIDMWRDDEIEIALDGLLYPGCNDDDHQYAVAADGRRADFGDPTIPLTDVSVAVQTGPYGWNAEIRLSIADLQSGSLYAGRQFGFDLGMHDDDDGGNWDSFMIWEGAATACSSSTYGLLYLNGTPAPTPVPTSTPTSTRTATPTRPWTPTPTPTHTPTPTRTHTPSPTPTRRITPSPTPTRSGRTYLPLTARMATATPTLTAAPTDTPTPTPTLTGDPYEPNDTIAQAWGPLVSGATYLAFIYGPQDREDFYFLAMPSAHTIEVWLRQIPQGHDYNLYVYNASLSQLGYSGSLSNSDEHILVGPLPAGVYYVRVRPVAGFSATQPYSLQTIYR